MDSSDEVRARERRWMSWLALVAVVLALAGAAAGTVAVRGRNAGSEPLDAGTAALFIGLSVAVTLATVAFAFWFVLWRRRRGSALYAPSPLWELPTQKQRSHLVRALRRGDPVAPEQRHLALRTAHDITRRHKLVWLYLGLTVLQAANAVIQDGWQRWLYLAGALLFLALAVYWAWLVRRMHLAVRRLETDVAGPRAD